MELVIALVIGVAVGGIVTLGITRVRKIGILVVNHLDPEEGPYCFLELSKTIDEIESKKYVLLKVRVKKYSSR